MALTVEVNKDACFGLYANRVKAHTIDSSDHYRILSLHVNCGISKSDRPEAAESKAQLAMSVPFIDGGVLSLTSPDKETLFYAIDLNSLIPEGWFVHIEQLTASVPAVFGLILSHPDYVEETRGAHRLTNDDCRAEGTVQCETSSINSYTYGGPIPCARESGHRGLHQAFGDDVAYMWDVNRIPSYSHKIFGFRNICPHCGFITAGTSDTHEKCDPCHYWLDQLHAGGGLVINGVMYRQGTGGGSRLVNLTLRDGSKWSGEIVRLGKIPHWLQDTFPDNAKFVGEYHW